jgi:hypothetical protein
MWGCAVFNLRRDHAATIHPTEEEIKLSNPQAEKLSLDSLARLQQAKINSRQFALTMSLELIKAPNYSVVEFINDPDTPGADSRARVIGGDVTHVALLAMATDFEAYIMGDLEKEAMDAIEAAQKKLNGPRIVRP